MQEEIEKMATTDYEPPWEWSNNYREEQIRKNSIIEKRRKRVQKTRVRSSRVKSSFSF